MDKKEHESTFQLLQRINALTWPGSIFVNEWRFWRMAESRVGDVWLESPSGQYMMFRDFDHVKVAEILQLIMEPQGIKVFPVHFKRSLRETAKTVS
jgi:hypothetical protein